MRASNRRRSGRVLWTLGLASLALFLPAALGAAPPASAPAAPPASAPPPVPEAAKTPEVDPDLAPSPYSYEVRGRRDPFRSLLIRKQVERSGIAGPAGMTVDELELQGTIRTKTGWIAMMRGADNRSYLLKKGAVLFDGEVSDISAAEVTFRQNVNDPASPKPFRDVVKSLALQHKQ